MAAHPKHVPNSKSAAASPHEKGISGEEGKIAGIRKPKQRLRRIKLAAKKALITGVAIAAGAAATLAPTPASAKTMGSLTGPVEFSIRPAKPPETRGYLVNLPEDFESFPKDDSASARVKSLEQESKGFMLGAQEDGTSIFEVKDSSFYLKVFVGKSSATFRPLGSEGFMFVFSPYGMQNPVPRMEKGKGGKMILHILDANTDTDLTLSFSPGVSSFGEVKPKAFRKGAQASTSDPVSKNIAGIVGLGEKMLEQEKPKTIEETREVYGRMGAEMVNELKEECSAAPPEQATELAKRGQAAITATLLRLYVLDDPDAVMELERLRADPSIDQKKLEGFAWKNGVLEEFQAIWPQCSATSED